MNKDAKKYVTIAIAIGVILFLLEFLGKTKLEEFVNGYNNKHLRIIASTSTKSMYNSIKDYAKKEGFYVDIEYYGDLEIVDKLNNESSNYDAVWMSNSIWLYMLENQYLTSDSKSIVIDPVVMGIEKSKATELGFVDNEVKNSDILNAIKNGKLKYVMSSVTKTNTGATAYLSFLNTLEFLNH